MAEVLLSNVRKSFGRTDVIHGIDLHIRDGDFVALVGPSGCGKSTLLRMVAGLEPITHGDVSIGGRVVTDLDPKDRDIAMVFQNYALYPHMTVAANMGFSLEHRGRPKAEVAERVRWAADGSCCRAPALPVRATRTPPGSCPVARSPVFPNP